MKRKERLGFTLVELLVVIAVIAIIAAILFPVLAQAREKARQAVCLSNLHQIGMASELYTQDYDETFLWNPGFANMKGNETSAYILRTTGLQRDCVDGPASPGSCSCSRTRGASTCSGVPAFPGCQRPGSPITPRGRARSATGALATASTTG